MGADGGLGVDAGFGEDAGLMRMLVWTCMCQSDPDSSIDRNNQNYPGVITTS